MTTRHYRFLIIGYVALGLTGAFVDYIFPALLPQEFHEVQSAYDDSISSYRSLLILVLAIITVAFGIASTYGLYMLRTWAPKYAVVTTMLALVTLPFGGVYTESGLATALNYAASYMWGAVVILPYIPPLNALFQRDDG